DELAETRSQLAMLILKEPDSTKPDTYRARFNPLEERIDKLEAELSARSARFRAHVQPVTLAAVQAALPVGSALVEFAVYTPRRLQIDKPPRYLAYVLAAEGQPKWVDLGEAETIDRAVGDWRKAL